MVDERLKPIQQATQETTAETRDQGSEAPVAASTAREIGNTGVIATNSLRGIGLNRSTAKKLNELRRAMNTNIGRNS